jgi:hypothetical protein
VELRLLAFAAAKAVAGELAELMAAADVVEGAFRREAEERWGAPRGGAKRVYATLAELGYKPEDRPVLEAVLEAARRMGLVAPGGGAAPARGAGRCPVCGAALGVGGGLRHASEAHADAVNAVARTAAAALGWELPPGWLARGASGGGWWGSSRSAERLGRLEEGAREALRRRLGAARSRVATVRAKALAADVLRALPRRERNPLAAAAAAKRVLSSAEEVEDGRGRRWRLEEWDGRAARFSLLEGGE